MTKTNYGAALEEWQAFYALAPTDLLPTICDPSVEMVAKSVVRPGSKIPSRVLESGKGAGFTEWTGRRSTKQEVLTWQDDPRHGICIVGRYIRAIDIDVDDRERADAIEDFIYERFPGMPCRMRQSSGSRMLLFRLDHPDHIKKKKVEVVVGEGRGVIELLFDGCHFLVAGAHPSGDRYEFPEGIPASIDDIPELTHDEVVQLYRDLVLEFSPEGASTDWENGSRFVGGERRADQVDVDDPIVQFLYENDFVLGEGSNGMIYVRSPWAHLHSTDSGPSSVAYIPAGVGATPEQVELGIKPPHAFVSLHASDSHQNVDSFLEAIGYNAALALMEFDEVEGAVEIDDPRPRFSTMGKAQLVKPVLPNVLKALRWKSNGFEIARDSFRATVVYRQDGGPWQEFDDDTYTAIRDHLTSKLRFEESLAAAPVKDAASLVASENEMDSAQLWLESKQWDGVKRIERFHIDVLKLEDTPYHRAVANYMWTALAGRIITPGVKADMVPILSGPQGLRKSTFVQSLVPTPDQATVVTLENRDADLARQLRGKMVAEWAELRGMNTREADAIKGWVSQQKDEWVPKFKEFGYTHLRRWLLIGTSNEARFLNDPTGGRRWLPLYLTESIDTELLERLRDQYWAEAREMYLANGVMWKEAEELARDVLQAATIRHAWVDVVVDWLEAQEWQAGWTSAQLLENALNMPRSSMTRGNYEVLRRVMTYIGWYEDDMGRWQLAFA